MKDLVSPQNSSLGISNPQRKGIDTDEHLFISNFFLTYVKIIVYKRNFAISRTVYG
jgi:hypothetical protein